MRQAETCLQLTSQLIGPGVTEQQGLLLLDESLEFLFREGNAGRNRVRHISISDPPRRSGTRVDSVSRS